MMMTTTTTVTRILLYRVLLWGLLACHAAADNDDTYGFSVLFGSAQEMAQAKAAGHNKLCLFRGTDLDGVHELRVVWVSAELQDLSTTFSWRNDFGVYASTQEMKSGVKIAPVSWQPTALGSCYAWKDGGLFEPCGDADFNEILLRNSQTHAAAVSTLGLYDASLEYHPGRSSRSSTTPVPFSATSVLAITGTAAVVPLQTITVGLCQDLKAGTLANPATALSGACVLQVSAKQHRNVLFDASRGSFVCDPAAADRNPEL